MFDLAFFRQIYYVEFGRWNFMTTYYNLALKIRSCTSARKEILELDFYKYVNNDNTVQIDKLSYYVDMKHKYFSI